MTKFPGNTPDKSFLRIIVLLFVFLAARFSQAQQNNSKPTRFDSLQIRADHPRIWVDADKWKWLKEKCKGKSVAEVQDLAGPSITGTALTYLITGDEKSGRTAISRSLGRFVDPGSPHRDLNSADGAGKRRSYQPNLAEQAFCYDWCYPLLSSEEKKEFRNLMVPLMKKRMDFKRAWRSFHNGLYSQAWPVVASALALYGDEPFAVEAWAYLKPELEDVLRTFDNVFPDGAWAEGMDYNRHSTYQALRMLLAIKSATGKDFIINSPHIKNTGAYILYSAKANGLALPSDDNDWPYIGYWERDALLMINAVFKNGYNQYFINHCPDERFQFESSIKYSDLLWYDPSIKEKPLSELPLSRIFRGKGLVLAKNGWNWDKPGKPSEDDWLSFHCGDYFGDHVHYDINSFTISHKGELAIDAGRYDDDWDAEIEDPAKVLKSQFFNYYKRSIAHNTILVKDPNEIMNMGVMNDGGQMELLRVLDKEGRSIRNVPEDYDQGNFPSEDGIGACDWKTNPGRWETGDITSYKSTKDFMYVRGDGTKAYSAAKMNSYVRQLVYLQPHIIIVMDRVVSVKPEFKKTWLLHTINEPIFDKTTNSFEITEGQGRLVCVPVLPHKINITKIGGPGNEFLVDSAHFKCGMESWLNPSELHYGEIPGAWRIEESPAEAAKEDYFLNVILVSDKNSKEIPLIKVLSESAKEITIQVDTKDGRTAILKFTKGKKPAAQIKIMHEGKIVVDEKMPEEVDVKNQP